MVKIRSSPFFAAYAAVSFLGLAVAAELVVRALFPMDALVYQDSENPRLGFELRPGAQGRKNGVKVEISADGTRDTPVASPKPSDERRVVVVGGHETFGVGVSADDLFVRQADHGLDVPGRVRTVNLSMYSYNLAQKVELACSKLAALQPELVVLQTSDGDAGALPSASVNAPGLKNWLRARSALARLLVERRFLGVSFAGASHSGATPTEPVPAIDPAAGEAARAAAIAAAEDSEAAAAKEQLRRFWDCVKQAGASGAVMMIPSASMDGKTGGTAKGLKQAAKELGLPYADAGAALNALPAEKRRLIPGQPFLSPDAHRAVAGELRKLVKPLLKKKPKPKQVPSV